MSIYLLGIPFKIVTDCQAFMLTMNKKDLYVRVARWALLLEEFHYRVEHRPGKSMVHVDALIRNPLSAIMLVEENVNGIIVRLREVQKEDVDLRKIRENAERCRENGNAVRNDILYKEVNDVPLNVVPKQMQTQVVRQMHKRGHFGTAKTEALLKRDYWFKELRARAKEKIIEIRAQNRKTFNKKRNNATEYKQGQLVAIKRTQTIPGLKFHPKYLGLYRVTKALRNNRYIGWRTRRAADNLNGS